MRVYRFSINSVKSPLACAKTRILAGRVDRPTPISTPCIKVCAVSGQIGLCMGCGRTLNEIAAWGRLDEAQRQAIMRDLPRRLAAEASA